VTVAEVRNITSDELSLFRADAPPIQPGDTVTVKDENFVGRAWPKSTWALVKKPAKPFVEDTSVSDAYVYIEPEATEAPAEEKPEGGDES
jgi:hypothetical protein